MKTLFQNTWFWLLSAFVAIVLLIGFAVWQSYQPKKAPTAVADNLAKVEKDGPSIEKNNKQTANKAVDPALPAPAKKLSKLINEPVSMVGEVDDQALSERISALDKKLAELNKQLEAQGIPVPNSAAADKTATPSDDGALETAERLEAIEAFMEEKEQRL